MCQPVGTLFLGKFSTPLWLSDLNIKDQKTYYGENLSLAKEYIVWLRDHLWCHSCYSVLVVTQWNTKEIATKPGTYQSVFYCECKNTYLRLYDIYHIHIHLCVRVYCHFLFLNPLYHLKMNSPGKNYFSWDECSHRNTSWIQDIFFLYSAESKRKFYPFSSLFSWTSWGSCPSI